MVKSMADARNTMSMLAFKLWSKTCEDVYGHVGTILFNSTDINEQSSIPLNTQPFSRVTIVHATQRQSSLSDATGLIKWNRQGIITIQCFAPVIVGNAFNNAEKMSNDIRDGFQKASCDIWFRKCAALEVGVNKGWYQFNTIANFEYDEVK